MDGRAPTGGAVAGPATATRAAPGRWRRAAVAAGTIGRFARCAAATWQLWRRDELHLSGEHVGWQLDFGDGSTAQVYRETRCTSPRTGPPCLLVVVFRLRGLGFGPWRHALFRAESVLNTPLFAGFPGFRSKLWLTDPVTGRYRGVYEWDGPGQADAYAHTLSRLLRLVCEPGSVAWQVVPELTPADVLAAPAPALDPRDPPAAPAPDQWWSIVGVRPAPGQR